MKAIASALVLGLVGYCGSAMAFDGTITINGQINANTCTITGTTGKDVSVTLPTLSTTALSAAGQAAGTTPFQLALSNCNGMSATTHFELGGTVNQTTGNLINSGTASNVEVRVLNNQFQPINIVTNAGSQTVTLSGTGSTKTGTMNYYAQYLATGAATAGTVTTSVQYSMNYN